MVQRLAILEFRLPGAPAERLDARVVGPVARKLRSFTSALTTTRTVATPGRAMEFTWSISERERIEQGATTMPRVWKDPLEIAAPRSLTG